MILLPLILLILYIVADTYRIRRYRKKIKHVIHVNGTRGKSTVVRMLDEVFRENGYRTFSKVTGTIPMYRDCRGTYHVIKRITATLLEQKHILRKAYKDNADILIVECMALKETMQAYSESILKADVSIITNARIDHLEVMGNNIQDICDTLFKMTHKDQWVLVGDDHLYERFGMHDHVHLCGSYRSVLNEHISNTNLVFEVSKKFGLNHELTHQALMAYEKSPGFNQVYAFKNNEVLFGFSMNDLETTTDFYKAYESHKKRIIWYNSRMDRPTRDEMFLIWLAKISPDRIILSGDQVMRNKRRLKKLGYNNIIDTPSTVGYENEIILGIGNIKGIEQYIGDIHV